MKRIMIWAIALIILTACDHTVTDEVPEAKPANSQLQVRTRSADDTEVCYPVQVYVFQGEKCEASQTISSANEEIGIALPEGTYAVYAIGGVSSTDYVLPAIDDLATSTFIPLREGRALTDLMAAWATVVLTKGGTNTVTLGLVRKIMLVQNITISQVPATATAVTVTFSPLWQHITVDGNYSKTNGIQTVTLSRENTTTTWSSSGDHYLLPPNSQPASISVNITDGGTTKTYTYSSSDQLEAGYKLTIIGTYNENTGVELSGTIRGATWLGERTISFSFNESGSTTNPQTPDNPTPSGGVPKVGDTYQGCYVLAVTDAEDHADVTLLSPNEATVANKNYIASALSSTAVDGIEGWEVPTKGQLQLVEAQKESIGSLTNGKVYLWIKTTDSYGYHTIGGDGYPVYNSDVYGTPPPYLRPVAVVTIAKE